MVEVEVEKEGNRILFTSDMIDDGIRQGTS